ncbi:hypothetical protein HUG10_04675 [Halorarum halophilum]|uniref:Uncharacterized protein n=1 Tax=Halorarum halophilum TaxID=2743090 RepID=A0A7D5KCQ2_9EURY|nr:hypothetical protein [Halobaculum halophilum]QLG26877.1 hypothetical protein HUG10_04675 [Halobaculum halophilum]
MRAADVLVSDYSGSVTDWHHTGRSLIQLTDIVADRELPAVGLTTDRLRIETVERLYAEGVLASVAERRGRVLDLFGVPMDRRTREDAAGRIMQLADGEPVPDESGNRPEELADTRPVTPSSETACMHSPSLS